jgi:hypothetical protein
MLRTRPEHFEDCLLASSVGCTDPKQHAPAPELGVEERRLIVGQFAPEQRTDGPDAARRRGGGRDGSSDPTRSDCKPGGGKGRYGCGETGPQYAALPQVGIADNRFARCARIVRRPPEISGDLSGERGMCKKTQLGPVDPPALEFRYGPLELFCIVEDGHSLANCRLLHCALSSAWIGDHAAKPCQQMTGRYAGAPPLCVLRKRHPKIKVPVKISIRATLRDCEDAGIDRWGSGQKEGRNF